MMKIKIICEKSLTKLRNLYKLYFVKETRPALTVFGGGGYC